MIPIVTRNLKYIEDFKSNTRKWEPGKCNCKLCKDFIPSLGYENFF